MSGQCYSGRSVTGGNAGELDLAWPPLGSQSASHGQAGALPKAALMAAQLHLPAHHPAAILVPSRGSLRSNQT